MSTQKSKSQLLSIFKDLEERTLSFGKNIFFSRKICLYHENEGFSLFHDQQINDVDEVQITPNIVSIYKVLSSNTDRCNCVIIDKITHGTSRIQ